ncbi:MAG: DinB family protein [Planctomycetes bacterium]|nr:DinB family protein [Planctomycetota bacterium]
MDDLPSLACNHLSRSAKAIAALVAGLPPQAARWAPTPEAWSTVAVLAHLADEEVEDFRTRVRLTLQDPAAPWSPIDPTRAAVERGYAARDAGVELRRFLDERERSLLWLGREGGARWENVHQHPSAGPLSARALLASWMAHDLLHLRQLGKLQHGLLATRGERLDYAGPAP